MSTSDQQSIYNLLLKMYPSTVAKIPNCNFRQEENRKITIFKYCLLISYNLFSLTPCVSFHLLIWRVLLSFPCEGRRNWRCAMSSLAILLTTHSCRVKSTCVCMCVLACGDDCMICRLIAAVEAGGISSGSEWNTFETKGSSRLPNTHICLTYKSKMHIDKKNNNKHTHTSW